MYTDFSPVLQHQANIFTDPKTKTPHLILAAKTNPQNRNPIVAAVPVSLFEKTTGDVFTPLGSVSSGAGGTPPPALTAAVPATVTAAQQ